MEYRTSRNKALIQSLTVTISNAFIYVFYWLHEDFLGFVKSSFIPYALAIILVAVSFHAFSTFQSFNTSYYKPSWISPMKGLKIIFLVIFLCINITAIEYVLWIVPGGTEFNILVMLMRGLNILAILPFFLMYLNIFTLGQLLAMIVFTKPVKDGVFSEESVALVHVTE